ncbi:hypothetical protein AMAG_11823 [Allomyces macrogynus ATCC 38327]|uniref:Uncharacterized protein n=1 Tax=Allomyces macrogynus (strain ATCC 38327) TaxID=578462 RepID=A0A0L0SY69_ALLM3|nr:hypothetical protein AMAG_11823 [Allomyces macrogynus ATCC 38327]|eukprot:KNE67355.1 hypothetical protein AMAG_11823 [Allomyces macrogynus ATCC 38327]
MDAPTSPLSPATRPLRRVPSRRKSFPDMRRRHRKSSSASSSAAAAVSTAVAPSLSVAAGGPSTAAAGTATASGVKTPVGASGARSVLPLLVSSPTATATGAKSGLVGAPRTPPPPRILVTAPDLVAADDDHHHTASATASAGAGTTRLRRSRSTSAGHAYTTISLVVRADPPTPRVVDELDLAIAEDPVDAIPPTPTKDDGFTEKDDKDDARHHGHHRTGRLSASASASVLPQGAASAKGATAASARVMPPSALKRDSAKDLSAVAPSIPVIAHSYHGDEVDYDDADEPYQSPAVFLQSSSGWDTCFDWCQTVDNDVPGTVLIAPAATPPPGLCIGGSSRSSTAPPSPTTSATSSTLDIPVSAELGPPLPRTASATSLTDLPSPFRSTPGSPLPGKSPRASTARAVRFSPAPPQVFATYAADEAAGMRQSVPQARLLYPDMHDLLAFQAGPFHLVH